MDIKKIYLLSIASLILILIISPIMVFIFNPIFKMILIGLNILLVVLFGLSSLYCIFKFEINYKKNDPRSTVYTLFLLVEIIFAVLWKLKVFKSPSLFEEMLFEPFVAFTFIPAILIFIAVLLKYIFSRPRLA